MNRNDTYDVRRPGNDVAHSPLPVADYPLSLLTRRTFANTAAQICSQREAAPHRIAFRGTVSHRPPKPV